MTYSSISERLANFAIGAVKNSRFIAFAIAVMFTFVAMQPAQAQNSNTWKSIAIIGGSTAAGAYIGHKVAGSTGTFVGAAVGASAGYAIDKRRRDGQYYNNDAYNQGGYYPTDGYYGNNGGYNGPYDGNNGGYNGPYNGNGGYSGGPYDDGSYGNPYPAGYLRSNSRRNSNPSCNRR